jgi:hypothetical protein
MRVVGKVEDIFHKLERSPYPPQEAPRRSSAARDSALEKGPDTFVFPHAVVDLLCA